MHIHGVQWYTQLPTSVNITCFGVIYGTDGNANKKAFIGAVNGRDPESGALDIACMGASIKPEQVKELYDFFFNPTT